MNLGGSREANYPHEIFTLKLKKVIKQRLFDICGEAHQ